MVRSLAAANLHIRAQTFERFPSGELGEIHGAAEFDFLIEAGGLPRATADDGHEVCLPFRVHVDTPVLERVAHAEPVATAIFAVPPLA